MPALGYSLNFASSCNFGLRLFVWYHDLYMMIAVIGYGFHPMRPFVVIVTLIEFHVCFFPSFCWLPPSSLSSSFWKKILLPTACEFVVSGKSTDMILSLLISLYFPSFWISLWSFFIWWTWSICDEKWHGLWINLQWSLKKS